MRQKLLAALMILSLLLTACGGSGDESKVTAFCAALAESAVTCEAEVTAVYDDESESFTLSCAERADGAELAVLAPELLKGVTARMGRDTVLQFDGLVLPVPLGPDDVSPLAAIPLILETMRTGHLDLVWREGDTLAAQFIPRDDLALRVFFSAEDLPTHAELIQNGTTVVRCDFTQWNQTETEKEVPYESDDPNLGGDQSRHPGA